MENSIQVQKYKMIGSFAVFIPQNILSQVTQR